MPPAGAGLPGAAERRATPSSRPSHGRRFFAARACCLCDVLPWPLGPLRAGRPAPVRPGARTGARMGGASNLLASRLNPRSIDPARPPKLPKPPEPPEPPGPPPTTTTRSPAAASTSRTWRAIALCPSSTTSTRAAPRSEPGGDVSHRSLSAGVVPHLSAPAGEVSHLSAPAGEVSHCSCPGRLPWSAGRGPAVAGAPGAARGSEGEGEAMAVGGGERGQRAQAEASGLPVNGSKRAGPTGSSSA